MYIATILKCGSLDGQMAKVVVSSKDLQSLQTVDQNASGEDAKSEDKDAQKQLQKQEQGQDTEPTDESILLGIINHIVLTGGYTIEQWGSIVETIGKWYEANVHTYQGVPKASCPNKDPNTRYDCPLTNTKVRDDCSGYVSACLTRAGVLGSEIYSSSEFKDENSAVGKKMIANQFVAMPFSKETVQPFDIMAVNDGKYHHVEIYAGDNKSWSWGNTHDNQNGNPGMPCGTAWDPYSIIWRYTGSGFRRGGGGGIIGNVKLTPALEEYLQQEIAKGLVPKASRGLDSGTISRARYLIGDLVRAGYSQAAATCIAAACIEESGCNPFNAVEPTELRGGGTKGTSGWCGAGEGLCGLTFWPTKQACIKKSGVDLSTDANVYSQSSARHISDCTWDEHVKLMLAFISMNKYDKVFKSSNNMEELICASYLYKAGEWGGSTPLEKAKISAEKYIIDHRSKGYKVRNGFAEQLVNIKLISGG